MVTTATAALVAAAIIGGVVFVADRFDDGPIQSYPRASFPSMHDPKPAIPLAGPGSVRGSHDDPHVVSANSRGEVKVDHTDPIRVVRAYHAAVSRGDMESVTECYIPERREHVAGMLGAVPREMDHEKLAYEIEESRGELVFVRVTGKGVHVGPRTLDINEKVKLRRVRGHWYLDDL